MLEIERKFLVNKELWNEVPKPTPFRIQQSYLSNDPNSTVRVRLKNEKAYLTIKSKTIGISRKEFEYEIPFSDAEAMIQGLANKTISKKRYEIIHEKHTWEVDVFEGKLTGLVIAEIELSHKNESFNLPNWVEKEVSDDPQYFNSKLIEKC
ncbi:MAG: CYTH domain-containing protein [Crocinitomicaceae bacterium]